MFIGSKSTSTVLDVFKIGLEELIRQTGMPEEIRYKARDCEMIARSTDFTKRIDDLRIVFPLKAGADPDALQAAMQQSGIGGRAIFGKSRSTATSRRISTSTCSSSKWRS